MATGGTPSVGISVVLTPESEQRLIQGISDAFASAMKIATAQASVQFAQLNAKLTAGFKGAQGAAQAMGKSLQAAGITGAQGLTVAEKELLSLVNHMKNDLGHANGVIISELAKLSTAERRNSVERTNASDNLARLEIENARNIGRQQFVEGQRAVVVARGAAKSRVIIIQEMARTIGRIEKALGVAIAGIARTTVSAFSKVFSGLAGIFRRDSSGIDAELRRTTGVISRDLKGSNSAFTQGLSGTLSKREQILQRSFRAQETILTKSAIRQRETLAGLRTGTQTGVIGAANRGLNIGAILGGAALFTAVRSTFSIGSNFVRGLAVLQAQLGLTDAQMKGVDALSIKLGNDISLPGVSALDAAQAIQILSKQFGSLGPAALDAAEKAAKGTLQLSRAAGVGAEDAAGIIGAAVNVFGISADKAVSIADQVAGTLAKAAGVSFEDFKTSFVQGATVFNNFVGPAEDANSTLLDFNTTLAVLAKNGIVGETAGAGLKQFFLSASKQSDKAISTQKELAKRAGTTGTVFFDAAGKARKYDDSIRILRAGLVGYTDQEKQATLTTLFGVRSQTIASAIIKGSQKDYDALRDSIQQQGLAAKIAAAQNTGAAGALDALRSVVETMQIQLFKKLNPALHFIILNLAILINNILSGTGAFAILRRGLLGIAAGMGAVIAAKAAVEVVGLLGKALTLATTPFGAVLVAAGLLGAAISILASQSEPFRHALGELVDKVKELGKVVGGQVSKGLSALGGVIERDVTPFVQKLVEWLSGHLVDAFDATVRFVTDKLIPAIKTAAGVIARIASVGFRAVVDFIRSEAIPAFEIFVGFLLNSVVPAAVAVGTTLDHWFGVGLAAVKGFWHTIEPIVRPMIDGFHQLANAIGAIFTGQGFADLGKGFSAAGSGIAASFSTIGKNLLGVLDRAWLTVQAFIKDKFSGPNLTKLGGGVLDFVEFLGHSLGAIVTNPTFLRGVGIAAVAIAGAAALVAIRFLKGFGEAFLANFPDLVHLLGAALRTGVTELFKAAFSEKLITTLVIVGILAVFRGRALFQAFRLAGEQAGGGFTGGFRAAFAGARGQFNTLTALLGGPERVARTYASGLSRAFKKETQNLQRDLRALGSTRNFGLAGPATLGSAFIGPVDLRGARADLRKLGKDIDDATLRGLRMRDSFKQSLTAVRGAATGLGTAFKGVGQLIVGGLSAVPKGIKAALDATNAYSGAGTGGGKAFLAAFRGAFKTGASNLAGGLSAAWKAIKQGAVDNGTTVGRAFGSALGKAAVGAVAIASGFLAGKAEGEAGGSGLISALLGGVTAGALIGGGFGAAVGVLTAGAGLVGAAFGRAEAKAKAFREEVGRLASAFRDDLASAIKDGRLALSATTDNLNINDVLGAGNNFDESVKAIADKLNPNQLDVLHKAGVNLNDVVRLLADSGGDLDTFREKFQASFLGATTSTDEFRKRFHDNAGAIQKVLNDIIAPGGNATIADFLGDTTNVQRGFTSLNDPIIQAVRANASFLQGILGTADAIGTESDAIALAVKQAEDYAAAVKVIPPTPKFPGGGADIDPGPIKNVVQQSINLWKNLVIAGESADEANAELAKLNLPQVDDGVIKAWQKDLDSIRQKAQDAQTVLDGIPQAITDAINAANGSTGSQVTIDEAIVNGASISAAITDAITKGGTADNPQLRLTLNTVGDDLGKLIAQGIAAGTVVDPATAAAAIEPVKKAMIAALDPNDPNFQASADVISLFFANAVTGLQPVIDTANAAAEAAKFQTAVADFLAAHPLNFTIDEAEFFVKNKTNLERNQAAFIGKAPKSAILTNLLPSDAEFHGLGAQKGTQITKGIAVGMISKPAFDAVDAAVAQIKAHVLATTNRNFKISSPSKVMHETGQNVTAGIAQGIEAGSAAAAEAARAAAQAAVDAANGVVVSQKIKAIQPTVLPAIQPSVLPAVQPSALPAIQPGTGFPPPKVPVPLARTVGADAINQNQRDILLGRSAIPERNRPAPVNEFNPVRDLDTITKGLVAAVDRATFRTPAVDNVAALERIFTSLNFHPGDDTKDGALRADDPIHHKLDALISIAEALSKRGPDVTNVAITETKDPRATARATIAELRADRLLRTGVR